MTTFDWTQLNCPLPMLRVGWRDADGDDSDELLRTIEPCNHPLHIYTTSVEYALTDGPSDGAHPWWRVKCEAGHVVFTYDDEGNDYDVPFVHAELVRALYFISPSATVVVDPPFPPHDGSGPDVNPATGDERETTTGPATDGPWDGPDDDEPEAA